MVMRIATLDTVQVLASLRTNIDGLSRAEATRRLSEYGPNRLKEIDRKSLLFAFVQEFTHFFALILWFAAGLCFLAEHYDPGQGMVRLGIAILSVILVNGLFSFWQEYKAEQAIAALRRLLPVQVTVMRAGQVASIDASDLVPGDLLLLDEGNSIPADCRLIEATQVRLNTATLTGESRPQARDAAPCEADSPIHARNLALAGTQMVSGRARAIVYATGMHTEFGAIAHLTQTAGATVSPLKLEIQHLSRILALIATGLGLLFFTISQALGLPFWENLLFAIGIIVANVPEGLLPTITLALAMATQRMAKRNALVRHLPAVEALGSTTVILSDKTGTLTQNRMSVKRIWLDDAFRDPGPLDANDGPMRDLLENAARCQDIRHVEGHPSGDPTEVALIEYAVATLGELASTKRIAEFSFDSDRKRMSVIYALPAGRTLYCKGALETVLPQCVSLSTRQGNLPLDGERHAAILAAQDTMAHDGLRVLAFAQRNLGDHEDGAESGLTFLGLIGLEDPPRPEVPHAVSKCAAAGIRIIMCTGDHPGTALAIAREIGLIKGSSPLVVTGDTLRRMNRSQLQLALDAPDILFARMGPEQKLRIVETLKAKGETVAVTGDGVNDAPALKSAHIGIAMGIAGTDVAKEAADLILLDDNFASIVSAVEEGRAVFENIRKFMTYILTSNIPEIVPYLAFVLFKIPLPLTIIQILAVDLGTDMVPALALGAEPPDPEVMRRSPRRRHERLLSWRLLARAYLFLGLFEAAAAMAAFFAVLFAAGWSYGQPLDHLEPTYLTATTACLAAIVMMQLINLFLCRDPLKPATLTGLRENPLIAFGLAVEIGFILAIVYLPAGQWLFGTAALGYEAWLIALPFALAMFLLEEGRKAWLRHHASPWR